MISISPCGNCPLWSIQMSFLEQSYVSDYQLQLRLFAQKKKTEADLNTN